MKNLLQGSLKILGDYFVTLLIFGILFYPFINLTGDKFSYWLPFYSFAFFLMLFCLIYSDMKRLAAKEKRPQHNLGPHPLKGLAYGIIGFAPVIILELLYPFIALNNEALSRLKELVLKFIMGPLYFLIKLVGSTTAAYIIASLVVPVVSMLSYMAEYYGFEIGKYLRKTPRNDGKKFEKSPWNPSVNSPKARQNSTPGDKK